MSTPQEEAYAIVRVREFLLELLDPSKTPRVPRYIRERVHRLVKHYPLLPTRRDAERAMQSGDVLEMLERLKNPKPWGSE